MPSGADEIVRILKEAGVRTVFGIPSIHTIRLYEALRRESSIQHILCRQEATAAHMADGYARAGNRLGVVISSTGPGSGYMVPALQEAWGSCSPVLMITANIPSSKMGKGLGVLHELENQEALFRSITKATISVRAEDDLRILTEEAVRKALSERPGPVYLEVPTDLLDRPVSGARKSVPQGAHQSEPLPGLQEALSLLHAAERPLLIVGTGAVRAGLGRDVTALAEQMIAPVVTPTGGKGVIPEDHPLSFGSAARKGIVRELVSSCDVAVAIGTRLRQVDAKRRGLRLPRLIHVDWDDRWVGMNFSTEVALVGDVPAIVKALLNGLEPGQAIARRRVWIKENQKRRAEEIAAIRETRMEMRYLEALRRVLPREGTLVIDNTQLGYWAEYFYPSYCSGGLVAAKGSSIIGFAFAAAVGAKVACPKVQVLALIGDGGFLYSSHELATCIRHKIGFPVIVVNDNAYGVIAHLQRTTFQKEYESRLTNPDFVALAQAYGAQAIRVDSPEALEEALERAFVTKDMWVIELATSFPEPPFSQY